MDEYNLKVKPSIFLDQIEKQIAYGENILANKNTNPFFKREVSIELETWDKNNKKIISDSFTDGDKNYFYKDYNIPFKPIILFNESKPTDKQIVDSCIADIKVRISLLKNLVEIVRVGDYLDAKNKIEIRESNQVSLVDKVNLILSKLHKLQGDNFYSLKEILLSNGIIFKSKTEESDLIKYLENKGYIDARKSKSGMFARIIMDGIEYIENKQFEKKSNTKQDKEINKKYDIILERLETLGLGQEIIYEELEELIDLYGKINKKSWTQLLKGKLIDFGINELLDNENIKFIYETFTDNIFKLQK